MMPNPCSRAKRAAPVAGPLALVALLLLSGPAALLLGCGGGSEESPEDPPAEASADPPAGESATPAVIPVAVHLLESGNAAATISAWGSVRPHRKAEFSAEVSGQVSAVRVGLGDRVRSGQVLLEVDPNLFVARVREAESLAESARLTMEKAQRDLERSEALFERGTISDSEIETVRTRTAEAEAGYTSAQSGLELARKNLSAARLRAPFDGHVASRPPDVGSTVNLGVPLLTVVDIDRVRVEAQVSEQDLARVRTGMAVEVTTEGAPGEGFSGTLVALGPQADAATRQFPVEVEVDNRPGHRLKGGMVARVRIVYETLKDRPLVPVDALVETTDGLVIFVVRDGIAHERAVVLGPRREQLAAVVDGAAAGDSVVVLGQTRLAEGSRVRVEETR